MPMESAKGSVVSDLGALWESAEGADVTLVVGDSEYPAHSAILSARSPVFAAMLRSHMKEACSCRIEITDMREDVLRQVLSFIYTDTAPQLASVAGELLPVADKYDLPLLKKRCEEKLAQGVDVENAGDIAALAVMHRCPALRAAVVRFMAGHPEVLATGGWAQVLRENAEAAVEISRQLAGAMRRTTAPEAESPRKKSKKEPGNRIQTEDDRKTLGALLLGAASRGQNGEVAALLGLGAPVDARGAFGNTALHLAAGGWRELTVKSLISAGADVNARNSCGEAPLHGAAGSVQGEHMVAMLLAASAHVDPQDRDGQTPLHKAAKSGRVCSTKALLLAGASKHARNNDGETPRDVAHPDTRPLFDKY